MGIHMIRVIAAVVDQHQLTLYKESGETVSILQGDSRLAPIIQSITPILTGGAPYAEIDLGMGRIENPYSEFENLFGKAIQFFRVDRSKLAGWLAKGAALVQEVLSEVGSGEEIKPLLPITIGSVPTSDQTKKLLSAAEEIIANAMPASHPAFHDKDTTDSTVVAVVGDKVVADIENLKPQITRAVTTNSPKGMQAFMKRVAAVSNQRRHSVEDLLKFLTRGDLPIADDGTIIIYKVLRIKDNSSDPLKRSFADCRTGLVTQRVGSYVCMDPSLVDQDRRNECSNGLHVARRAYVGGFSGDVCVLAKVKPEDVIAVPDHDANKMRVCGYHILFELPEESFLALKQNRPFTDNEAAQLMLGKALSGDHGVPMEEVRITEQNGGGVKITKFIDSEVMNTAIAPKTKPVKATALESDDKILDAPKVDPKEVVKAVSKEKADVESRKVKALRLFKAFKTTRNGYGQKAAAQELADHKKVTKQSWTALGLTEANGIAVMTVLAR